jgi:carbamoyltransferase
MYQKSTYSILGIHHSGPIASCALIQDGKLVAAIPEERFSRIKQDKSFPHQAINYCLKAGNINLSDLDAVSIAWNPGENVSLKYREGFSEWMRYPGEWLAAVPNHLLPLLNWKINESTSEFINAEGRNFSIQFVDHHACHAHFAYDLSGFAECAIFIADGWSEQKVTTWIYANGHNFETIKTIDFPNSIGCFYAAMTDYLGYRPFSDEWKIMGMAAYGNAANVPQMDRLISLQEKGEYELALPYFDFYNFDRANFYGTKMETLLGPARSPEEPLNQRHFDIAAAAQMLFEKVMTHALQYLYKETGSPNLALTGGVAMNCLYNGKVVDETSFSECSVTFAPDDSGNSIGAALAAMAKNNQKIRVQHQSPALGPDFSDDEIAEILEKYKLRHRVLLDIPKETAELIAEEKVVGWFQGRSEFGQRALGHRSIFASPQKAAMKDRINSAIKYRESYRPFAPMLQLEKVRTLFNTEDVGPVRYMEKAFLFKKEFLDKFPAVVHHDQTGRLQSVAKDEEPLLHHLLQCFEDLSGCPIILNTSFNLNGEPIVNSPEDCLRTFITSGMDAVVMGKYLLEKNTL